LWFTNSSRLNICHHIDKFLASFNLCQMKTKVLIISMPFTGITCSTTISNISVERLFVGIDNIKRKVSQSMPHVLKRMPTIPTQIIIGMVDIVSHAFYFPPKHHRKPRGSKASIVLRVVSLCVAINYTVGFIYGTILPFLLVSAFLLAHRAYIVFSLQVGFTSKTLFNKPFFRSSITTPLANLLYSTQSFHNYILPYPVKYYSMVVL